MMTTTDYSEHRKAIAASKPFSLARLIRRWETILLVILFLICTFNSFASPYFLNLYNLFDSTQSFTEKAIIALSMTLVIIARDIDLSVASIIALTSTVIGWLALQGVGAPMLLVVGILVGVAAGAVNGFLITRFDVPAIVVTIGTMSLFRGISYVVLGDGAYTSYPAGFSEFGQGYLFGMIPYEFIAFLVLAVVFGVALHKTVFGRHLFAAGNNPQGALYSGINVNAYRFWLFTINGMMAGLAGVLFTSRVGATRPNMAQGWELDVVAMVVLGGVSIMGGSGTIPGVVISVFVLGMLMFGLGLLNVPGILMTIIVGCLLIAAIALPIIGRHFRRA
jgi:rhamnose transport system permease protein